MKTRLLKLSLAVLALAVIFLSYKIWTDDDQPSKTQKVKIAEEIMGGINDHFKAFSEIKLPIFLGSVTNGVRQHLHIEGGIGNPFFITGSFTSEVKEGKCEISNLKLEIIPTGASGAKVKNYKFKDKPTVTSDGNGGLNIDVSVIEDTNAPRATPNSTSVAISPPISVSKGKIIDMHVHYSGGKNNFTYEGVEFCCPPVICKSIIYF